MRLNNLFRELRLGLRTLSAKPGFSLVVVVTLALAIAACTTIYAIAYSILLHPLAYPEAGRLVQVWQLDARGGQGQFSDPNFEDLRDRSRAFAAIAEHSDSNATIVLPSGPVMGDVAVVSAQFFDVFQTPPFRGRLFGANDQTEAAQPVAIISYPFWQRAFGGQDASTTQVTIGDRSYSIIGVMPAGFDFPEGIDVWTPREQRWRNPYRTGQNWRVVARLRSDAPLASARANVTAVARQLKKELGDDTLMVDTALVPLRDQIVGPARRPLVLLVAAAACLLLITCANVANLLLVHVSSRRRELAVRSALGAGRLALAGPLVSEIAILSATGGLAGLLAGAGLLKVVMLLQPGNLPRQNEIAVSWPVVMVIAAVSVGVALILAGGAAWNVARADVSEWLKQGQRSVGNSGSGRLRSGLVIGQIAASLVLLVSAGLIGRSLALILSQSPGFRTEHLLTVDLSSPSGGTNTPELNARLVAFHSGLLERLAVLPGVRGAGGVNRFPLGTGYSNGTFLHVFGDEPPANNLNALIKFFKEHPDRAGYAEFRIVSGSYFEVMGIPLVRGRVFDQRDASGAPHSAVISESLAKKSWPGEDPIGRRVQFGGMDGDLQVFTIVGVVGDIQERSLGGTQRPTFYADYGQRPVMTGRFTIVLHARGDPASLIASVRSTVRDLDPEVAPRFRTVEEVVLSSVADRRFDLFVLGAFAATALALAIVGIYGVMAYVVAQRLPELGVRIALGAQKRSVWLLVLGQAAWLVATGLAIGVAGSWMVTRLMRSMLFGITPNDPLTVVSMAAILLVTAVVACQVPAIRATRVDPLTAMRAE